MIILFKKLKELPEKKSMYLYKVKQVYSNNVFYFINEKEIDSEDNFTVLVELIANDYIKPISWKYFLDFIVNLPLIF